VLGSIFVFPHLNEVRFYDSNEDFKLIDHKGVDFEWYKNEDQHSAAKKNESVSKMIEKSRSRSRSNSPVLGTQNLKHPKKFAIVKDSTHVCFDRGDGHV
jgi:hypothetical protein